MSIIHKDNINKESVKRDLLISDKESTLREETVRDGALEHANHLQHTVRRGETYDAFYHSLKPLPKVPVAGDGVQPEAKTGYKERKRREKELKQQLAEDKDEYKKFNKTLSTAPRLLTSAEVKELSMFQTKMGREKWAKEKMPHSKLTREQTIKMILEEGDFSNFENLDNAMRNMIATKALNDFKEEFHIPPAGDIETICGQLRQSGVTRYGKGVSGLLNPALRLGLSLAQRSEQDPDMKRFYLELDEAMSTAVMVSTLTCVSDQATVERYYREKGASKPAKKAQEAIEANKAQQIQIAKRLLLMQLSDFKKTRLNEAGGWDKSDWDKSMAVALSHCSRVVLTLPKQAVGKEGKKAQKEMWKAILTIGGKNKAEDNSRFSSTHSVERRNVLKGGDLSISEEKKRPFNLIGQRGMNCAIGGLGNAGISGKMLSNDGSCGHFYSMHKEGDETNQGVMLMGLESDASGVTNQMGHTHDIRATAEKASSLGGQRTDEVGEKYGGRQCNLAELSPEQITKWMLALEKKMEEWQKLTQGMENADAVKVMELLSGKKMTEGDWTFMRQTLNLG